MAVRTGWIVAGVAAAAIAAIVVHRATRAHPRRVVAPADAGVVPAVPPPPVPAPPQPDVAPGGGHGVTVRDDATSAPAAATLIARDAGGRVVEAAIGVDGQGALALAPGTWTVEARDAGGRPLEQPRGGRWTVGANPPPWIEVRTATPRAAAAPPPPPAGTAQLVGVATLDGTHPADVVVTPIFLGGFGPGHAVTHERVPTAVTLPPRRFIGTGGAWRLDDLPPGGYAVHVVVPWRAAALVRATAAADVAGDASATLSASVRLSGAVLDQRGAELAGATVRVLAGELELARLTTDARGAFRALDVPAGATTVEARAPGCYGDRKAETYAPGTDVRVTLALVCEAPEADDGAM